MIIRREVRQRVRAIAPFLTILGDPYMISVNVSEESANYVKGQNQYWIVEGYTTSTRYPYASSIVGTTKLRYIRNSVKAVVDAYNGLVTFYIKGCGRR